MRVLYGCHDMAPSVEDLQPGGNSCPHYAVHTPKLDGSLCGLLGRNAQREARRDPGAGATGQVVRALTAAGRRQLRGELAARPGGAYEDDRVALQMRLGSLPETAQRYVA